jgi:hypothetical protein
LAVALTLAFSSAAKADANKDFVGILTVGAYVTITCNDYTIIDGGSVRLADRLGANFETFGPATGNALKVMPGGDYDRDALIPEVTQYVRSTFNELDDELNRLGKARFCRKLGGAVTNTGLMRKK